MTERLYLYSAALTGEARIVEIRRGEAFTVRLNQTLFHPRVRWPTGRSGSANQSRWRGRRCQSQSTCATLMTVPSTIWSLLTHRCSSAIKFSCRSTRTAAYCTLGFTRLDTLLACSQASGSSPAFEALPSTDSWPGEVTGRRI